MDYFCKVSGATGLSLSIVSGGEEAYAKHFGFRDLDAKEAPDGETTYFIGSVIKGNLLLPKSESIRTWAAQPVVRDFRSDFLYNNYAYDVVGRSIEMIEQKNLQEVFKERDLAGNPNAAKAYYTLEDAASYEVPIPTISRETIMGAGGAIRSCTNDLAKYYNSFMHAVNHQFNNKTTSTPDSPFKKLSTILRPHNQLDLTSLREQSYAQGWGQTETAIIAMQNSSGLGDAYDWIPEIIIQKLSGSTECIDFLHLAAVAAKTALSLPVKIQDELQKRRERGTRHLDLEAYTGRYWNALQNFSIDVSIRNDRLYMNFQDIVNETYELRHAKDEDGELKDEWVFIG
ncbi:D-aminoacylase [Fusarium acutatum]|uniref:D-aminoacylase n=1 Tax=Fusarium acutatum TaxID=78861 RepID=A0A8H4JVE9_9HYPO|nr:D-aminoacylase [Fusarium acutatum]